MKQLPSPHSDKVLNRQRQHWETTYLKNPDKFGVQASEPARHAAGFFKENVVATILELGAGQGRDTLYFAQFGFQVYTLDYSEQAASGITERAAAAGLAHSITAGCHDIRTRLPFDDATFDACYSHMLYCMALSTAELEFLSSEVWRVLKPGGLQIYTVRHTNDAHYGTGIHRGEDMYEVGGFIVHFFSKDKVEHLEKGFELLSIDEFEEGGLHRKLFRVTLRKKGGLA